MHDVIGYNDMTGGGQASFTTDRFGKNNQALNLNDGYASIGGSLYFSTTAFSISLWIYPVMDQFTPFSSVNIFDSGNINNNGPYGSSDFSDDIILYLNAANSEPIFQIYYSKTCVVNVQSSVNLINSQWHHLTATYDGVTASIYINGTLASSVKQAYSLTNQSRMYNYFGGNRNFGRGSGNFGQSASHLDDIRFYNISLTPNQILNIMNFANTTCNFIYLLLLLQCLKKNTFIYIFGPSVKR